MVLLQTPYEEAQRRALYARALRLPEGVVGVPQTKAGMCFECEVCGEVSCDGGLLRLGAPCHAAVTQMRLSTSLACGCYTQDEESSDDVKLECDMCRCVVHTRCYGVTQPPPPGALWLCDVCQVCGAAAHPTVSSAKLKSSSQQTLENTKTSTASRGKQAKRLAGLSRAITVAQIMHSHLCSRSSPAPL